MLWNGLSAGSDIFAATSIMKPLKLESSRYLPIYRRCFLHEYLALIHALKTINSSPLRTVESAGMRKPCAFLSRSPVALTPKCHRTQKCRKYYRYTLFILKMVNKFLLFSYLTIKNIQVKTVVILERM